MTTHIPTIDELIELPDPEDAQISPDGRFVAYTVITADWKKNEYRTQLWLADVKRGQVRQLTFAKQGSTTPRWSPDSQWLAFLSQRDGDDSTQIYRLSPYGGEAKRLTELETDVNDLVWSPDGLSIAFSADDPETKADKDRKEKYGEFHVENQDYQRSHLWLLRLEGRKVHKLTAGDHMHVAEFRWSPQSDRIAIEAWPTPDIEHYDQARIGVVALDTLQLAELTAPGWCTPTWSPDGSHIACLRYGNPTIIANKHICVLPAGGGEAWAVSEIFDEDPWLLEWGPDGIYFSAIQRTAIHLFRIDPETGHVQQLTPQQIQGWVSIEGSFTADFRQAATVVYDDAHLGEVVVLDLQDGSLTWLTDFSAQVQGWPLGETEVIQWTSADGTPIEGVLTRPADFDPARRHPLLVLIHGGPTWVSLPMLMDWADRRVYPVPLWLAKGALILRPNYRGSAGYGQAFRALNIGNLGVGDAWDVVSGVEALIERGWVDPKRVGAMGWSQGGYISAFLATNSDRFQAFSVGAGISNWVTYYVNTDIHPFTRQYLGATPWENLEVYRKTSPMTNIGQARTPTLIQHGENDARVPTPNAYELYQGLRDVGVEARLVIYKDTGHSIRKPRLNRQAMQENLDWFNRWIWGEMPAAAAAPPCYVVLGSAEKQEDADKLPASERYTAERIGRVQHWARRDRAGFRIFSGQFGLLRADDPVPHYAHLLQPAEVSAMAARVAQQMEEQGLKQLVLFTDELSSDRQQMIHLGCLQVAAAMVEQGTVEHREVAADEW